MRVFSEEMIMQQDDKATRRWLHRRTITVDGYLRDDGLYDIEGHLRDIKGCDVETLLGRLPAGEAVHDMHLRLTVNEAMVIQEAEARMTSRPYPGTCENIVSAYAGLKGLAIAPGFTRVVRSRLGGLHGCTHLTEMVGVVATVAFQTRYGTLKPDVTERPPHLDGCHALATDGAVVARFYPHWSRATAK